MSDDWKTRWEEALREARMADEANAQAERDALQAELEHRQTESKAFWDEFEAGQLRLRELTRQAEQERMDNMRKVKELGASTVSMVEARDLLLELLDGPVRMRGCHDPELPRLLDQAEDAFKNAEELMGYVRSGELDKVLAHAESLTEWANDLGDLFGIIFLQFRERLLELAQVN